MSLVIAGANRHDKVLLEDTLNQVMIELDEPTQAELGQLDELIRHLCLDAGYDYEDIPAMVESFGYTPHIRPRDQEKQELEHILGYRARRWVVERTTSWLNRFRRILIRWEKKPENYLAFLHLACALICFRSTGLFG